MLIIIKNENWSIIPYPEYEFLYISCYGCIMRLNGVITEGTLHNGYLSIDIYHKNNNNRANLLIHIIVEAAFLERNDELMVNHKDGNKLIIR